ncbi:hypothetical protein EG832_10400, partial [bacterium]|nr:hypothetical protein [bacterium]
MANQINPFTYGRIEFEDKPVIYMPDDMIEWVSSKPYFFMGPRGSGKSARLKALSWEVTWKNSNIELKGSNKIQRLRENPTYLGVYYRIEDMEPSYWDLWRVRNSIDAAQQYFGTYINFLYLDLFLNAINSIRKIDYNLFSNSTAEHEVVNDVLNEMYPNEKRRPKLADMSYRALREIVLLNHIGIRNLIFQNATETEIRETYPVSGPGTLIQAFGEALLKYYKELSGWNFMVLIDDCNILKEWQAIVINTAVAKARIPISYKLTSDENLYPTRRTLNEERTIVEHD